METIRIVIIFNKQKHNINIAFSFNNLAKASINSFG